MVALPKPTFNEERALLAEGYSVVAGVDEAGMGCWAGPVTAAAVILPSDPGLALIRDSKTLSEKQREGLVDLIKDAASAWAVGWASAREIDEMNIRQAGLLAMRRAVEGLSLAPHYVLSDGFLISGLAMPTRGIVGGDRNVTSIAAASIIAKVARDRHMAELAGTHTGYGFERHKGYGTKAHAAALAALGPCIEHRMTYAPVKAAVRERERSAVKP